jgi:hypothetical protein
MRIKDPLLHLKGWDVLNTILGKRNRIDINEFILICLHIYTK